MEGKKKRNVRRVYLNTDLLKVLDGSNREGYIRNFPLAHKTTIPWRAISTLWIILKRGPCTTRGRFTFQEVIYPGVCQLILDQRCLPLGALKKSSPDLDYEALRHYVYRNWTHEIRFLYSVTTIFKTTLEQLVPGFHSPTLEGFYTANKEWTRQQSIKNKDNLDPKGRAIIEQYEKLYPTIPDKDLL